MSQTTPASTSPSNAEREKALACCDRVERELLEIANGERKPGKLSLDPIGRLIEFIRNGKNYDVTLTRKD